jgi:hypothetical protein
MMFPIVMFGCSEGGCYDVLWPGDFVLSYADPFTAAAHVAYRGGRFRVRVVR